KVTAIDFLLSGKTNVASITKAITNAQIISECVNFSRRLGDTPGNLMTPEILADETVKAAKGSGLKVTVWDKARIKKEKFGGLYGVSLGSALEPKFIIMEYMGAAKSKKPVCFVGKGLTFDCGGISIKPSSGMEEMKYDMCGGANVIGTMLAIARLKLKINAVGYVPSSENMPGPLANKPGDILVARNGKTVEVDNTDAEGRLILMDALSYASEQKPAAIFDAATLTGACVVALGNSYTGSFTRDKKIRKNITTAAEKSGELVWQMPINDHHVADMKGKYADLNNISSFKGAGSSTAAAFLEQFVAKDIPWAHFDIAGTAWHVGNRLNYCPKKGASGCMIRTFVELAQIYG
ncbi:MAG: leucyl aminopeptidase family protein, partial [Bdellovibrionales bacterium]|nr:leucyl aminopeptidase family protein [Bdellovibrionales bacterium]